MVEGVVQNNYVLDILLGKGTYGEVWLARNAEGKEVALKKMPLHYQDDPTTWENCQREVNNLLKIDSPYIIKLLAEPYEDYDYYNLVLEYCNRGTLLDYILNHEGELPMEEIHLICTQLVIGISKLHENAVAHRDLKLENILLHSEQEDRGPPFILKIADLGLSKAFTGESGSAVGSWGYCCPQVLDAKEFTKKCDVWSFGITLYQMAFKKFPFGIEKQYPYLINLGICHIPQTRTVSKNYVDLLSHCLQYKEENRYDINEVRNHPFFQNPNDEPSATTQILIGN